MPANRTMVDELKTLQHKMVAWSGAGPVQGAVLVGDGGLGAWRQIDIEERLVTEHTPFWGTVPKMQESVQDDAS